MGKNFLIYKLFEGISKSFASYLGEIGLTHNLFKNAHGISKLQKPSKIYLDNTNLIYLLARENANKGNLRDTFFQINWLTGIPLNIQIKETFWWRVNFLLK